MDISIIDLTDIALVDLEQSLHDRQKWIHTELNILYQHRKSPPDLTKFFLPYLKEFVGFQNKVSGTKYKTSDFSIEIKYDTKDERVYVKFLRKENFGFAETYIFESKVDHNIWPEWKSKEAKIAQLEAEATKLNMAVKHFDIFEKKVKSAINKQKLCKSSKGKQILQLLEEVVNECKTS